MDLFALIQKLWDQFISLFEKKENIANIKHFDRIKEAGDWRNGVGLWAGTLPIFTTRIYYLEVSRVSYADKRELNMTPKPTHTFKVYYFIQNNKTQTKERVLVFLYHKNCFLAGSSDDYIAVENIGKAIASRLKQLCRLATIDRPESIESEIVIETGKIPRVKLKNTIGGIPTITLLSKATEQSQQNWQQFINNEMQLLHDAKAARLRDKGYDKNTIT